MALAYHYETALAVNDSEGTDGGNTVGGAVVTAFSPTGDVAMLYDDESGTNGSTAKQTKTSGTEVGTVEFWVEEGTYDIYMNGVYKRRVIVNREGITGVIKSYATTAEIEALEPTVTGTVIENQELSNAKYALAASGYSALPGDLTSANGRVWELQESCLGWNIEHFGALEMADSTEAILDAIERAGGSQVYGRAVQYNVSETIEITTDGTSFGSPFGVMTIMNSDVSLPTLAVSPADPTDGSLINNVTLSNINLERVPGSTDGVALDITSAAELTIENFTSKDSPFAIDVHGIRRSNWNNILLRGGNATYEEGTSLLRFDSYRFGGSTLQPAFTTLVDGIDINGELRVDNCLEIITGDGLSFDTLYFTLAKRALVKLNAANDGEIITGVTLDGGYLDCNSQATGTESAIYIPEVSGVGASINTVKFSDIFAANSTGDLVSAQGVVSNFDSDNVTYANSMGGLSFTGLGSEININGGQIRNTGNDGTTPAISVSDASALSTVGITFKGNLVNKSISNITNHISSANNVINGDAVDDHYALQGEWTPEIRFGGGSTGITYSEQYGYYQRVGRFFYVNINIELSSKGTDTGNMTIHGFPFGTLSAKQSTLSVSMQSAANGVGDSHLVARILDSGTAFSILSLSGVLTVLNNEDINNTTSIIITGMFEAQ